METQNEIVIIHAINGSFVLCVDYGGGAAAASENK